jgi:hypothetical protein
MHDNFMVEWLLVFNERCCLILNNHAIAASAQGIESRGEFD